MGWETDPEPQPVVEPPAAPVEPPVNPGDARFLVIGIGASVALLAACVAWWLGLAWVGLILVGGAIAGPIAAWRRATAFTGPGWIRASFRSAVEAVMLAGLLVWLAIATATMAGPWNVPGAGPVSALWLLPFVVIGALAFGTPVAVPTALLTGLLVRLAARRRTRQARRAVIAVATVTVLAATVTGLAATGALAAIAPGAAPIDWNEQTAAVRLTLTIDNRTAVDQELLVGWSTDGGEGSTGSLAWAPACSSVTDRYLLEEADWLVQVADEEEGLVGEPLVTSRDWPGGDVEVTLVLASDGTSTARSGAQPADGGTVSMEPIVCG